MRIYNLLDSVLACVVVISGITVRWRRLIKVLVLGVVILIRVGIDKRRRVDWRILVLVVDIRVFI
jgi:hypothetical protein